MDKDEKRKNERITAASKSNIGRFHGISKRAKDKRWVPLRDIEKASTCKTPAQDRLKMLMHTVTKGEKQQSRNNTSKNRIYEEQENKYNDGPTTSAKAKISQKTPKKNLKRSHCEAENSLIPAKVATIDMHKSLHFSDPTEGKSSASVEYFSLPVESYNPYSLIESGITGKSTEGPPSSKLNNFGYGVIKRIKDFAKLPFCSPKKSMNEQQAKHTSGLRNTNAFKATSRIGVSKRLSIPTKRAISSSAIITQSKGAEIKTPQNEIVAKSPQLATPTNKKIPQYPRGSANLRLERLKQSLLLEQKSCGTTSEPSLSNTSRNTFHENEDKIKKLAQDVSVGTKAINSNNLSDKTDNSTRNHEVEAMDWQYITNDEGKNEEPTSESNLVVEHSKKCLLNDINTYQTMGDIIDTINENLLRISAEKQNNVSDNNKKFHKDFYYFILDTNVLLRDLTFVEDLSKMKLCDTKGSILYIPYSVLQELDKLKMRSGSQESVKTLAIRAIKYLNSKLENNSPHIQSQSAFDEKCHLVDISSADDNILNCCLQVKKHVPNLLLLTEDINLRNKAICNNIVVSTKSDLLAKRFVSNLKS